MTLAQSNAQDSEYTRRGCLEISLDSTQIFTLVVILGVSVRLVSKFLFRRPGKSGSRSGQVTSTQCTHFTLERLDLALHGGKCDGIDLTTDSHSDSQEVTLAATMKQYATASNATQNRLTRPHFQCCDQLSPASLQNTETPPKLSTPPFDYRTIHAP